MPRKITLDEETELTEREERIWLDGYSKGADHGSDIALAVIGCIIVLVFIIYIISDHSSH